jgi:hypothetical protein
MRLLARMLYRRLTDMLADWIAREEPLFGPGYCHQLRRICSNFGESMT